MQYELVRKYHYELNFHMATEALVKHDIDFSQETEDGLFCIYVNSAQVALAEKIIRALGLDDTFAESEVVEGAGQDMPTIDGYTEWGSRQYDPGHYTGGKMPQWYEDPKNLRIIGPLVLFSGIGGILLMTMAIYEGDGDWSSEKILFSGLYLFAGVMITRRAYKKPRS